MSKVRWYHKPVPVIVLLLCFGPFALPFLWSSPAFGKVSKIALSVLVILATFWLIDVSIDLYKLLIEEMKKIQEILSY